MKRSARLSRVEATGAQTMSMRGVMTLRAWVSPKSTTFQSISPSCGSRIPSRVPTSMNASISSSEASLSSSSPRRPRAREGTSGVSTSTSGQRRRRATR